ncbi:hypothetical protein BJ508DRAFT_300979 [Ascobolus immersus RN42]|uniref:Uncharacterized protein n=1 Tax=Ascobolus immersus RN42 TaxID=1160509 RepID=A0A3N4IP80_ASCIM|nr:hypothetical protein BJ508DRAFT_300979 [Ascobolus immersus RN42]
MHALKGPCPVIRLIVHNYKATAQNGQYTLADASESSPAAWRLAKPAPQQANRIWTQASVNVCVFQSPRRQESSDAGRKLGSALSDIRCTTVMSKADATVTPAAQISGLCTSEDRRLAVYSLCHRVSLTGLVHLNRIEAAPRRPPALVPDSDDCILRVHSTSGSTRDG